MTATHSDTILKNSGRPVMSKKKSYREEKDSLGTVKVPVDAYFGPQTQRAIQPYVRSRFSRSYECGVS